MSEGTNQTRPTGKNYETTTDAEANVRYEHEAFFKKVGQRKVPEYANIFFDSLYSEYRALATEEADEHLAKTLATAAPRLEAIHQKREENKLSWNDVYEFDLALLSLMPAKDLVRKAYDMRAKYRSIAGAKDYDAYIASKPPDLSSLDSNANAESPDAPVVTVESLRADTRYLLKQFYLYYAFLPYREGLRDELTRRARNMTFYILIVIGALSILGLVLQSIYLNKFIAKTADSWSWGLLNGSVVAVVVFAGIIGGCVSMLQRIQSAPSEGDALYNLAALSHGWKGIALSPLYGGIFATLLFILFSAGILKGAIFPNMITFEPAQSVATKNNKERQTSSNSNSNSDNKTDRAASSNNNSNSSQSTASAQATPPVDAASSASPTPSPPSPPDTTFKRFLEETYPLDGAAYALLVVWSFIAGFAERLVPDTLNRLVTKNESIQGTGG